MQRFIAVRLGQAVITLLILSLAVFLERSCHRGRGLLFSRSRDHGG